MPSCNTYPLTWVSFTLGVGYLFTTAPPDLECGVAPSALLCLRSHCSLDMGLLFSAAAPDLGCGVTPLGHHPSGMGSSQLLPLTAPDPWLHLVHWLASSKLRTFVLQRHYQENAKIMHKVGEKFANHISDKRLVSRI